MDEQGYADVIAARLTNAESVDFDAFARLVRVYRRLHPMEQPKMLAGLAIAIARIHEPGALADAIHLAYHLEAFDLGTLQAVQEQQAHGVEDPRLLREVDNYLTYQRRLLVRPLARR